MLRKTILLSEDTVKRIGLLAVENPELTAAEIKDILSPCHRSVPEPIAAESAKTVGK